MLVSLPDPAWIGSDKGEVCAVAGLCECSQLCVGSSLGSAGVDR